MVDSSPSTQRMLGALGARLDAMADDIREIKADLSVRLTEIKAEQRSMRNDIDDVNRSRLRFTGLIGGLSAASAYMGTKSGIIFSAIGKAFTQ